MHCIKKSEITVTHIVVIVISDKNKLFLAMISSKYTNSENLYFLVIGLMSLKK